MWTETSKTEVQVMAIFIRETILSYWWKKRDQNCYTTNAHHQVHKHWVPVAVAQCLF